MTDLGRRRSFNISAAIIPSRRGKAGPERPDPSALGCPADRSRGVRRRLEVKPRHRPGTPRHKSAPGCSIYMGRFEPDSVSRTSTTAGHPRSSGLHSEVGTLVGKSDIGGSGGARICVPVLHLGTPNLGRGTMGRPQLQTCRMVTKRTKDAAMDRHTRRCQARPRRGISRCGGHSSRRA